MEGLIISEISKFSVIKNKILKNLKWSLFKYGRF